MDKGDGGHYLHGGGVERQDFSQTYTFKYGQMFCGLTVVEFQLADEGPGDGGLAVIPGSHKANYPSAREAVPVRRTPRVRQRSPQPSRRRYYLHRSTDPRYASMAGRTPAPLADLQVQSILPSPRPRLPSDASPRLHPRHERRRTRHAQLGAASQLPYPISTGCWIWSMRRGLSRTGLRRIGRDRYNYSGSSPTLASRAFVSA